VTEDASVKATRVQRVVDLVEAILAEIAGESDAPYAAAPAMSEFCVDLVQKITQISVERLGAFIRQKYQPGD